MILQDLNARMESRVRSERSLSQQLIDLAIEVEATDLDVFMQGAPQRHSQIAINPVGAEINPDGDWARLRRAMQAPRAEPGTLRF